MQNYSKTGKGEKNAAANAVPMLQQLQPQHVPEGCNGMIKYHSWSCPTHNRPYFGTHARLVAMHRTALARSFLLPEPASLKAGMGVLQQFHVFRCRLGKPQLSPAIEAHHFGNNKFLAFNSCHKQHVNSTHKINPLPPLCKEKVQSFLPNTVNGGTKQHKTAVSRHCTVPVD